MKSIITKKLLLCAVVMQVSCVSASEESQGNAIVPVYSFHQNDVISLQNELLQEYLVKLPHPTKNHDELLKIKDNNESSQIVAVIKGCSSNTSTKFEITFNK